MVAGLGSQFGLWALSGQLLKQFPCLILISLRFERPGQLVHHAIRAWILGRFLENLAQRFLSGAKVFQSRMAESLDIQGIEATIGARIAPRGIRIARAGSVGTSRRAVPAAGR